nr:hypothetical protein [Paracoccus saliphilus]
MLRDADGSHAGLDWLIRHKQIVHSPDPVMRCTALAIAANCRRVICQQSRRFVQGRLGSAQRPLTKVKQTQAMPVLRHRLRMDQAASA